jgi:pantetheine-phosphate adenylyltransferase
VAAITAKIEAAQGGVVIDAPLLFEAGLDAKCDVTVAVIARREIRIERLISRDGLTREQAEIRINAQKPDEFYIKSADLVVHDNGGDLEKIASALRVKIEPKTAIYGGTFDPPTLGHLDIIRRAAGMFEKVYVAVLVNSAKKPAFSSEKRVKMLKKITEDIPNICVECFDGLLAEYAFTKNCHYSIRGIRSGFDADYERPMFEFNAEIAHDEFGFNLDTIFIPTTRDNFDTSSSNVRVLLEGKVFKVVRRYLDERIADDIIENYR